MQGRVLNLTNLAGAAVVVSLLGLLVVQLRPGFPAAHDAMAHVTYTYAFDSGWRQGQFPVRWVELPGRGNSQPLFNFYPPGFYYLVELVHRVASSLVLSLKLTVLLSWWGGAFFAYLLLKRFGRLPGALGAVLLAFSPYVLLDVFVRAAYPELAGVAWAVGGLWALDGYATTARPVFLILLSAFVGLMLMCHPPTTLIFFPVFAGFFAVWTWRHRPPLRVAAGPIASAAVGLGLAAFYVLPAIVEQPFVKMRELSSGYFDFHQHFVYPRQWVDYHWGYGGSVAGPGDSMSFQIGPLQWVALALALVVLARAAASRRGRARAPLLAFWLAVVTGAMFLMTGGSVSIWNHVAPMRFLQFPWRLLMLVSVGCAATAAILLSLVRRPSIQTALVIAAVVARLALSWGALTPPRYLDARATDIDSPQWADTAAATSHPFVEDGYFPADVTRRPDGPVPPWTVAGQGTVSPIKVSDTVIDVGTASTTPLCVIFSSPYFPGWNAHIDGRRAPIDIRAGSGYMEVAVPPGAHDVSVALNDTRARTVGNDLTLTSVAVLLGWTVWVGRRRHTKPSRRFAGQSSDGTYPTREDAPDRNVGRGNHLRLRQE